MSNYKTNADKNLPSGAGGIIILAGGLGTRLRSVVSDLPKCMAPVNGKPFLWYVVDFFRQQGITDYIFSLGYKHEVIIDYLNQLTTRPAFPAGRHSPLTFQYSIEKEPLGTGGAIKKASAFAKDKNVFVTNGDTLFKAGIEALRTVHVQKNADCTIALKPMKNFDRYGVIELNKDDSIKDFTEKKYYESGLINGGLYMLNVENFLGLSFPEKFSFEKSYLEQFYNRHNMFGVVQDEYFIDIGIPGDYERAQEELIKLN